MTDIGIELKLALAGVKSTEQTPNLSLVKIHAFLWAFLGVMALISPPLLIHRQTPKLDTVIRLQL